MLSMSALIYKPTRRTTQSGTGRCHQWVLEHKDIGKDGGGFTDPLTGWHGSTNTAPQCKLHFATRQQAVAYAERSGLKFAVINEESQTTPHKSYKGSLKNQWLKR